MKHPIGDPFARYIGLPLLHHPVRFYVAGMLISAVLISGMYYSDSVHNGTCDIGERKMIGFSIAIGAFGSLTWPLMLPMSWLTTGFAEHGIWRGHCPR